MKLEQGLEQTLTDDPRSEVAVIVHVQGDPNKRTHTIETLGLTITRVFKLTNTLALQGPALQVLQLAREEWVNKIESDRRITTMR